MQLADLKHPDVKSASMQLADFIHRRDVKHFIVFVGRFATGCSQHTF